MKMLSFFFVLIFCLSKQIGTCQIMHHLLSSQEREGIVFVWEETSLQAFDELLISWDAHRPQKGAYLLQVSVLMQEWSPWIDYAFWSGSDQYTFQESLPDLNLAVYQDAIQVLEGHLASGFRVRVVAQDYASLKSFRALHASAINCATHVTQTTTQENIYLDLDCAGLSQMALADPRNHRLCSPTSTTAVLHFLKKSTVLAPLEFANHVWDSAFDIYGNWILNTAQASHELGQPYHCFVARLTHFDQIIEQLRKGFPVVVSVKELLINETLSYKSGHLLVVKGYHSQTQEVFCMDPALPTNAATSIKYPLENFMGAWRKRQGLAYLFEIELKN